MNFTPDPFSSYNYALCSCVFAYNVYEYHILGITYSEMVIKFFFTMLELDYSNNSFNKVLFCRLGVTTSVLDAILVLSLVKLSKF
jgi:hypothetical protein